GGTLEAAAAVCDWDGDLGVEPLAGLAALVEHSLVRRAEAGPARPRFTMLETVREYALERLAEHGQEAVVRARHAAHYLRLAEEAEPEVKGAGQLAWLARLDDEGGNLPAEIGRAHV